MMGTRHKRLIIIAALALVALAAVAATLFGPVGVWDYYRPVSFVDMENERAKLIDGIESYQNPGEFKDYLSKMRYTWKEKAAGGSETGDKRPPFNLVTVTVEGYSSDGFTGRLSAIFFNDRLMSTIFYPAETERYIEYIGLKQGITFDPKGRAEVPPYTRVSHSADHKGRKFVIWEDVRLRKENEIWVLRYS